MKKSWGRKGQFYLIAAIAIILIILSLAVVPNNLKKEGVDNTKLYELFAEVNINDAKMIEYPSASELSGYTEENLEKIFDKMTGVYTNIYKIYVLINKEGDILKLYVYDKSGETGSKISEVTDEGQPIILGSLEIEDEETTYNFGGMSGDFYYLIIIEKSKNSRTRQQYVVKG